MEFTLWISPVLNAALPSSGGRTMITLGPLHTSSLPGRLGDRGDAPQWPPAICTPGVGTLFGLKIQPDCPSFAAANDHGVVTHTLLQSSGMHQTVSCRDLITPSPTHLLPAAGGGHLGLRWPGPGATPDLAQAPTPLHALPLPSTLTPLPLALHPLVFCTLPPAVPLPLWDVDPHLPPPFSASKVFVWRKKNFFMIFVQTQHSGRPVLHGCFTGLLPFTG